MAQFEPFADRAWRLMLVGQRFNFPTVGNLPIEPAALPVQAAGCFKCQTVWHLPIEPSALDVLAAKRFAGKTVLQLPIEPGACCVLPNGSNPKIFGICRSNRVRSISCRRGGSNFQILEIYPSSLPPCLCSRAAFNSVNFTDLPIEPSALYVLAARRFKSENFSNLPIEPSALPCAGGEMFQISHSERFIHRARGFKSRTVRDLSIEPGALPGLVGQRFKTEKFSDLPIEPGALYGLAALRTPEGLPSLWAAVAGRRTGQTQERSHAHPVRGGFRGLGHTRRRARKRASLLQKSL